MELTMLSWASACPEQPGNPTTTRPPDPEPLDDRLYFFRFRTETRPPFPPLANCTISPRMLKASQAHSVHPRPGPGLSG
jgi:hypothetical protein